MWVAAAVEPVAVEEAEDEVDSVDDDFGNGVFPDFLEESVNSYEGGITEERSDSVRQTLNQRVVRIGVATILTPVNGTHGG